MPSRVASACCDNSRSARRRRTVRPIAGRANFTAFTKCWPKFVKPHTLLQRSSPDIASSSHMQCERLTHRNRDQEPTVMQPMPTHAPDGMNSGMTPAGDPERFAGIRRDYTSEDVERLAGSFRIRHTLAEMGAQRLWSLLR